jgi:hypothetical protein
MFNAYFGDLPVACLVTQSLSALLRCSYFSMDKPCRQNHGQQLWICWPKIRLIELFKIDYLNADGNLQNVVSYIGSWANYFV